MMIILSMGFYPRIENRAMSRLLSIPLALLNIATIFGSFETVESVTKQTGH